MIYSKKDWVYLLKENELEVMNVVSMFNRDQSGEFKGLLDDIDSNAKRLSEILSTTWIKAPDVPQIHDLSGWRILCDLCSENWVLAYKKAS